MTAPLAGGASPPFQPLMAPGLGRRIACLMYESMLLFGIAFGSALVFSVTTQMRSGIDPRRPWLIAFMALMFGLYFTWCWTRPGQTLAMKTWHISVVDRHGRPLRQARALFRYACCWLWVLPPLAVIAPLKLGTGGITAAVSAWVVVWALLSRLHPERQFWHDALAGTRLVPSVPPGR